MKRMLSTFLCAVLMISVFSLQGTAEKSEPAALTVKAKAAVLMDAVTVDVLFAQSPHEKLYPASVTKVMSLLLFMEALDRQTLQLTDTVTTSADAAQKGGSQIWLKEGETMTIDDLLKATVIGSANDACCVLAEKIAGSEQAFVQMMNDRAQQLGMKETHFVNCTGLDDDTSEHLTSAYDVALMSRELLRHEKIRDYTTVWMESLRNGETQLVNTNKLVRFYAGTTGLKTGTTAKAGCCITASAERSGLHLIAVVLGADNSNDRFEGAKAMLNWGFAAFETAKMTLDNANIADVVVLGGTKESITPAAKPLPTLTMKKGVKDTVEPMVSLPIDVEAPVEAGQVLGKVDFVANGEIIASVDLIARAAVARLKPGDVLQRMLSSLTVRVGANEES